MVTYVLAASNSPLLLLGLCTHADEQDTGADWPKEHVITVYLNSLTLISKANMLTEHTGYADVSAEGKGEGIVHISSSCLGAVACLCHTPMLPTALTTHS